MNQGDPTNTTSTQQTSKTALTKRKLLPSKLSKKILGKDKKLRTKIERAEIQRKANKKFLGYMESLQSQKSGILEADVNETTRQFRNKDIQPLISLQASSQIFDLDLEFGRYSIDFSRNGQELLIAGSKGHIAMLDWKKKSLLMEFHVKEKVRAVKFLQNKKFISVAQKECVYIYDDQGIELHRLGGMHTPLHLEYLPYHYLLASISERGKLVYQDVSTGDVVAEHATKTANATFLKQNPTNGILMTGNNRGVVRFWSPNSGLPQASIFCHHAQVNDVAVTQDGLYMVSVGAEKRMKIWDLRKMQVLYDYWTPQPVYKVDCSQTGLVALGTKDEVIVWKDCYLEKQKAPYLKYNTYERRMVTDCKFAPFEDVLGLGLERGFSATVVPGAGEAKFDTFEEGIGLSKKQKREIEVRKIIEKLPSDMITMDAGVIGTVDKRSREVIAAETKMNKEEKEKMRIKNKKRRMKMRGREVAGKGKLISSSRKEDLKRSLIRTSNIKRLKIRMAEKVKIGKEMDELKMRGSDLQAITRDLQKKITKDLESSQQSLIRIFSELLNSKEGIEEEENKKNE